MRESGKNEGGRIRESKKARAGRGKVERLRAEKAGGDKAVKEEVTAAVGAGKGEWVEIFDAISDWVVFMDLEGRILRSNRVGEKFTGLSRDEIIGQSCCKLVHGSEKHIAGCPLQKMLKTGQRANAELKVPGKDCWLMVTVDAVTNEKGDVIGAMHIVRDITARKRAEEEIASYSERLKYLLSATTAIIYTAETSGDYGATFISDNVEKLTGYTAEGFVKGPGFWMNHVHPDDLELVHSEVLKLFERGEHTYEYRFRRSDGSYIWIRDQMRLVRDAAGKPKEIVGYWIDITERKRAEEEIERLAKFPAENPNPVLRISDNGIIIYSNEAGSPLLGTWQCAVGGCLPDYWHRFVLDALTAGRNRQTEIKCENRVYSLTFSPVVGGNYVNVYAMDITGRKKAIDELLAYQNKLRTMTSKLILTEERERRHIAEGLHDDIIQPLVFLKIKIDELRKKGTDSEVASSYEDMMRVIDELTEMTRGFTFELSCPVMRELGLEAGIEEYLTTKIQAEHGLATVFEDDGEDKPLDEEMRTFLFKAVRELLINTVKHAKASEVRVSIRRDEGNIIICVEDDGVGFEPVKGTNDFGRPSGFGLFSIRERLDYLGGGFKVESKLGHGTKVVLTAPLRKITKGRDVG